MADAFVAMRLAGSWAGHFGDVPLGIDAGAIARSAIPDSDERPPIMAGRGCASLTSIGSLRKTANDPASSQRGPKSRRA